MKHAAPRTRLRRGRAAAAAASALTIAVAVLGANDVLPVQTPDLAVASNDGEPADRARTIADRATRDSEPTGDATPWPSGRPTASPDATSPGAGHVALPAGSGSGRRIVYALEANHVWLVDSAGDVVRDYPVSGTRFDQLKPKTYDVIRKRRTTTSYHGTERLEYFVTFAFGENAAIGFHNIPVTIKTGKPVQTIGQLGQPLSDGCVRQAQNDAVALWRFAQTGTPVVVLA